MRGEGGGLSQRAGVPPGRIGTGTLAAQRDTIQLMRTRWPSLVALFGMIVALAAMLWPVRAHHGMWAVTVGSETTHSVPVGAGELITPIQVLIEGTAPQESALRSAVNLRIALALGSCALSLVAGLAELRRRKG